MNELIRNKPLTMSSKEIATLVGSRHDKVKQSIDRLEKRGVISKPPMGDGAKSANGVIEKEYRLIKRDSFVVVAQLSPEFTAKLVDRWQELEQKVAKQTPQLPGTYKEALLELVAKIEENEKLNTIIDNEFGYSSILRAATYAGVHETTFNWRVLKSFTTQKLGMEIKRVPSPRFGYQNLYPIRAFEMCYPDIDFDDLKPELVEDKEKLVIGARD